jgi:hypothetical protein
MTALRARWGDLLDLLLGDRCPDCRTRVFPKDRLRHKWIDHAGDDAFGGTR